MIKAKYCISKDTDGDLHISLPYKEPKLPDGKKIAFMNPSVEMPVRDVIEAIESLSQKRVNEILSNYF